MLDLLYLNHVNIMDSVINVIKSLKIKVVPCVKLKSKILLKLLKKNDIISIFYYRHLI